MLATRIAERRIDCRPHRMQCRNFYSSYYTGELHGLGLWWGRKIMLPEIKMIEVMHKLHLLSVMVVLTVCMWEWMTHDCRTNQPIGTNKVTWTLQAKFYDGYEKNYKFVAKCSAAVRPLCFPPAKLCLPQRPLWKNNWASQQHIFGPLIWPFSWNICCINLFSRHTSLAEWNAIISVYLLKLDSYTGCNNDALKL